MDVASATVGHEARLGRLGDALRGSGAGGDTLYVGGGLMVLKYTSDGFVGHPAKLVAEQGQARDPEDAQVYRAEGSFGVAHERGRGLGRADMFGRSVM